MRTIKVKGMSCRHCVRAVSTTLSGIEGVKNVSVDLASGEAVFEETKPVDVETLRERLKKAGYELG
jgi:copper chaperone